MHTMRMATTATAFFSFSFVFFLSFAVFHDRALSLVNFSDRKKKKGGRKSLRDDVDQENVGKGGRAHKEVSGWKGEEYISICNLWTTMHRTRREEKKNDEEKKTRRVRENFLLIMPIYAARRGENKKKKTIASMRRTSH